MRFSDTEGRVGALTNVFARALEEGMGREDLDRAILELIRVTATVHGVESLGPEALRMLEKLPGTKSKVHPSLWIALTTAYREAMQTGPTSLDRSQLRRFGGGVTPVPPSNQRTSRSGRSPLLLLLEERTTKGRSN